MRQHLESNGRGDSMSIADNDMRDRMAARQGDFEVCPVGTGEKLREAVEFLREIDTHWRTRQSDDYLHRLDAFLTKIGGQHE